VSDDFGGVTDRGGNLRFRRCNCDETGGWEAWHDRMPGTDAALHVTGSCTCPTPGYTLELRKHTPQGINPRDLLLELVTTEPTGVVPEVITQTPVDYHEQTEAEYDTVTIVPDGPSLPVRVASGAE
jgi:hypothetical protein